MSYFWDSGWGILTMMLGLILGIVLIIGLLIKGTGELNMPSTIAQIESIRRDASLVDAVRAEDTIGQVTEWNQNISGAQAYNRMFLIGWFVPDGWDQIKLIEIPRAAP